MKLSCYRGRLPAGLKKRSKPFKIKQGRASMLSKPNSRSLSPTGSFLLCCVGFSLSFSCCISFNWSRYVLRMALVCRFRCSSASSYSRRLSRSILPETGNVSTVSRNFTPRRATRSGEESSSVESNGKTRAYCKKESHRRFRRQLKVRQTDTYSKQNYMSQTNIIGFDSELDRAKI